MKKKNFFLSFLQPQKSVWSSKIARWLKQYWEMQEVIQAVFKSLSTKGTSTFKANKLGLLVKQIIEQTGNTFYNKPIENESKFSNSVLKVKGNSNLKHVRL